MTEAVLEPGRLGPLGLRNRVLKSATFEGMTPAGHPSDDLVALHRRLAAGGVAMTTVAYGAVAANGRTFADQLLVAPDRVAGLRALTDAVHAEGAAASLQLSHCGFFTRLRGPGGRGPRSASWSFNAYGAAAGLPVARPMTPDDLAGVVDAFGDAAGVALEAGFDAVELHLGHGYLLSQFLSPATNRRRDAWGGDLAGRLKLPLDVVRRVRDVVGDRAAVLAKTNLDDGFRGGLGLDDAVAIARALEAEGVDALVPSGGFTSRSAFYLMRGDAPLRDMIAAERNPLQRVAMRLFGPFLVRSPPFEELFFLEQARAVREAVELPLALLGGVASRQAMATARAEGFEFVALGRALLADPDLVARLAAGRFERSRCTHCNRCVAVMEDGGVRCVLDEEAA